MKPEIRDIVNQAEMEVQGQFKRINEVCEYNSLKVMKAFHHQKISETHLSSTTGYGYGDIGRDAIERVYADIFKAEDALVRSQFISGSHALTVALFGLLRPNDTMLSITGLPYDTLHKVIGIRENASSLKSYGINYEQIDLVDNDFDYEKIKEVITTKKIKLIEIQRSKGYSNRKSITIDQLAKVIAFIKKIDNNIIIMVDNCYCEFVNKKEPIEVGADIAVGSLIKNLGGGIAPNGAYIVGKKDFIQLCAERLNLPGEGKEVGPSLNMNRAILQGLYMAPSVVASSLKMAVLASKTLDFLGYKVDPKYDEDRADIVESITFNDKELLIKFVQGIQQGSIIDSYVIPEASNLPGYDDQVIMASGSFTQGSSIELSCDGPIRKPYIAYLQGSLTYEYGKLGFIQALTNLRSD